MGKRAKKGSVKQILGNLDEFIQVGDVNAVLLKNEKMLRKEIKAVIRSAHAIAPLAELTVRRSWDGYYYFLGDKVYIKLAPNTIFREQVLPAAKLVKVLAEFQSWVAAYLPWYNGSGESKGNCGVNAFENMEHHVAFLFWCKEKSRTGEYEIQITDIKGQSISVEMPGKDKFISRGGAQQTSREFVINPDACVLSVKRAYLVRSATGKKMVILRDLVTEIPAAGQGIEYPEIACRPIGEWVELAVKNKFRANGGT